MKTILRVTLPGVLFTLLPAFAPVLAQPAMTASPWEFTTRNNAITIVRYTGSGAAVIIPATMNGLPVAAIGEKAFFQNTNLVSVTIPASVRSIGDYAFGLSAKLEGVYFKSSAPDFGSSVFFNDNLVTVYYLRGTAGWLQECCDRPTAQWDPDDQADAAGGRPPK